MRRAAPPSASEGGPAGRAGASPQPGMRRPTARREPATRHTTPTRTSQTVRQMAAKGMTRLQGEAITGRPTSRPPQTDSGSNGIRKARNRQQAFPLPRMANANKASTRQRTSSLPNQCKKKKTTQPVTRPPRGLVMTGGRRTAGHSRGGRQRPWTPPPPHPAATARPVTGLAVPPLWAGTPPAANAHTRAGPYPTGTACPPVVAPRRTQFQTPTAAAPSP